MKYEEIRDLYLLYGFEEEYAMPFRHLFDFCSDKMI